MEAIKIFPDTVLIVTGDRWNRYVPGRSMPTSHGVANPTSTDMKPSNLAATSLCALLVLLIAPAGVAQAKPVAKPAQDDGRIPVLLITGANNHEWQFTAPSLQRILAESGRFDVTLTDEPAKTLADAEAIAKYRVFVLDYFGPRWGQAAEKNFLAAVERGAGVSVIHASNNAFKGWVEFEKLVMFCWRKGTSHGRFHAFDVKVTDRDHPLTKDMPDLRTHPDELYHALVHMHGAKHRVLATAHSSKKSGGSGNDEPMVIVRTWGKGRVFHTPLGHVWRNVLATRASHADPQFRQLVARGTEWAATGKVTLPSQPPNFLTAAEKKAGFRLVFNGRDLTGWRGYKKKDASKGWVVEDGAIHRTGGGGDLITSEQFGDFDLRFDWKVGRGSNSGVIYHVRETQNATYRTGPEYQVLDDANHRAGSKHAAASLYDMVAPKGNKPKPTGVYNTGRIVIRKGRLEHWLNGVKVVDSPIAGEEWKAMIRASKFRKMPEFGTYASGHIALQDHGNAVWYRSIRIKVFKD
jgi:type 1 glutamine amidotransferase